MELPEKGSISDLVRYRIETVKSDYDDFYIASKEKAEEQIMTAKELIEQIEAYYLSRLKG